MMFIKSAVLSTLVTLIVIVSPLTALAQVASSTTLTINSSTSAQPLHAGQIISAPVVDPYNSADVEVAVRGYFADIPVMAAIAKCESNFREYAADGSVLNGGSGGMIGVFQINKSVHATFALSLGDDITTLAGNMAYARYLYDNEGTSPWDSSEPCWGKITLSTVASSTIAMIANAVKPSVAQASTLASTSTAEDTISVKPHTSAGSTVNLSQNLKMGSVGAQVTTLQKLLNGAGYLIAKSGAGSPGHETSSFGAATQSAVQRFQCTHNIACSGTAATTGYGFVGAKTRAALMLNS